MKQAIIIVPLFLLLLAILYLFTPVFPDKITHEAFISADAPIFLTQYDLKKRVDEFKDSVLGRNVATLNYERIGIELGLSDAEITEWGELFEEVVDGYQNPIVQTLIGSEFSLALWPFKLHGSHNIEEQLLNHLLLISRPSKDARLLDFAAWTTMGSEKTSSLAYGNHKIIRLSLENDQRLSVVRVKDLVLMSLNEQVLRGSLDLYDNMAGGLNDNNEYHSNISRFEGASFLGYVDFPELFSSLNQAAQTLTGDNDYSLIDRDRLRFYRSGLFGAWRDDNGIVDKAVISINPEFVDQRTKALLSRELRTPSDYKKLSRDTIIYHWTNQFDAAVLLDYLDESSQQPGAEERGLLIDQIKEVTGLTIEQIIDLFGNDLTLAVRALDSSQLVPLPRFLLSVQSHDAKRLKQVADALISHFDIPVQRKMMGQTELITWGGVVGIGAVLPSLLFGPESIIISSNRQQIRRFLGSEVTQGLVDIDQFEEMKPQIMQPSHAVTYLDFAKTTEMLQEMTSWGGTMLAIKDRELARKSKILIDEMINPILEGLAMYSVIGSRKYIDDSSIVYESRTLVEDGN